MLLCVRLSSIIESAWLTVRHVFTLDDVVSVLPSLSVVVETHGSVGVHQGELIVKQIVTADPLRIWLLLLELVGRVSCWRVVSRQTRNVPIIYYD